MEQWNEGHRVKPSRSESTYTLTFEDKKAALRSLGETIGNCQLQESLTSPRLTAQYQGVSINAHCRWDSPNHIRLEIGDLSPAQAQAVIEAIKCN